MREYKDLKATLLQLGINNGACIKIERGKPHEEGVFELNICQAYLNQNMEIDDVIHSKKLLFKLVVSPSITGLEFKMQILEHYN